MPTYLCHGFRWQRQSIRIFVGLHDLMDAAPDWILAPATSAAILTHLRKLYPFIPEEESEALTPTAEVSEDAAAATAKTHPRTLVERQPSPVRLLEEYDPEETQLAMRPHAYVADYVVRVDLGVSVAEEMARYDEAKRKEAAAEGEKVGGGEVEAPWFERLSVGMQAFQKPEPIEWHVVVCGDEERHVPGKDDDE
jgi:hypothetical protein